MIDCRGGVLEERVEVGFKAFCPGVRLLVFMKITYDLCSAPALYSNWYLQA
jgi:hypothetical protein